MIRGKKNRRVKDYQIRDSYCKGITYSIIFNILIILKKKYQLNEIEKQRFEK